MSELLSRGLDPTAIFCGNDMIALSAMEAMRTFGLEPGQDVAVIGCDDMPMAAAVKPGLTTFSQNLDAIGTRMGRMILARLSGSTDRLQQVVESKLILRDSDMAAGVAA